MESTQDSTDASVYLISSSTKEERSKRVLSLTAGEQLELPFRRVSALSFIVIMLVFGIPLWWQTTSTYRVPFRVFPSDQQINLPIHVSIASSHSSMKSHVDHAATMLLNGLSSLAEIARLHLLFEVKHEDMDNWESMSKSRKVENGQFGVHVAVVNETLWPYSGYTTYFDDHWMYILNSEDETKLAERLLRAVTDVLLDISHLSAIVRRDLKQQMQPQEVAALSSSQQKHLIWDSAALNDRYIVQVIFVHTGYNESSEHYVAEDIVLNARRFATKLADVSDLSVSSEHLWDFDVTAWLKNDVQWQYFIHMDDIPQIITAIERETSNVEASVLVMKLVVLDTSHPVILLDQTGDDCNGVVVASWGAILSYGGQERLAVNQSLIAAMRVLFGLDTELPATANRSPAPVADWEIRRIKLRSFIDSSINGIASVNAIHKLSSQIDNIVINEEVAGKTNLAVELISRSLSTVEKTGRIDVGLATKGRTLAESAKNDKSLLALLYFPSDQKFAIYLPLFLPTLLPLLASMLSLYKCWTGKE